MYCSSCGKNLKSGDKFCSGCGTEVSQSESSYSSSSKYKYNSVQLKTPQFKMKPKFIPIVTILSILPLQIFFTLWGGGFFGGFGMFAVQALGLDLPQWFTFVFFACVFFFGIPILTYFASSRTYDKTEFRFYPDKLEYYEGFFTVEEKTIKYKNITEVNLRRGIFQRKYGLGTIILSTPATGFSKGRARSGIRIYDIENPEVNYEKIKKMVGDY